MKSLGWIALDIDGTITKDRYSIPSGVVSYLNSLVEKGWKLIFLTGRSFRFASLSLNSLPFPFFCAPQNGSLILEMPQKRVVDKFYIDAQILPLFDAAFEGISGNYLVYAGMEKGDFCYIRPELFKPADLEHVDEILLREQGVRKNCAEFDLSEISKTPLVKCFGSMESMKELQKRLHKHGFFNCTLIRDPFKGGSYLLLVTDINASKGKALEALLGKYPKGKALICAGDDENDISMLEVADIAIVMDGAPDFVKEKADVIAPPVENLGIISALRQVLDSLP